MPWIIEFVPLVCSSVKVSVELRVCWANRKWDSDGDQAAVDFVEVSDVEMDAAEGDSIRKTIKHGITQFSESPQTKAVLHCLV